MRERWKNPALVTKWQQGATNRAKEWFDRTSQYGGNPPAMAVAKSAEWLQGVQASQKLWENKLKEFKPGDWQKRVIDAGQGVYTNGLRKVAGYTNYVGKLATVMPQVEAALNTHKRGVVGSQANYDRVKAVGDALRKGFGKT